MKRKCPIVDMPNTVIFKLKSMVNIFILKYNYILYVIHKEKITGKNNNNK